MNLPAEWRREVAIKLTIEEKEKLLISFSPALLPVHVTMDPILSLIYRCPSVIVHLVHEFSVKKKKKEGKRIKKRAKRRK